MLKRRNQSFYRRDRLDRDFFIDRVEEATPLDLFSAGHFEDRCRDSRRLHGGASR
jgi:hypothetical protein